MTQETTQDTKKPLTRKAGCGTKHKHCPNKAELAAPPHPPPIKKQNSINLWFANSPSLSKVRNTYRVRKNYLNPSTP
jgi:hypothetical protein